jgi:hypothetical protein
MIMLCHNTLSNSMVKMDRPPANSTYDADTRSGKLDPVFGDSRTAKIDDV